MAFGRTKKHPGGTTVTTTTTTTHHPPGHHGPHHKPTLMQRLRPRPRVAAGHHHHTNGTATTARPTMGSRFGRRTRAQPVVHHKRKASLGDKMSGAMLKLKGSLTHRPGQKAAGTRRMHGTDGRGSRRYY